MHKKPIKLISKVLATILTAAMLSCCSSMDKADKDLQELGLQAGKDLKPVTLTLYFQGDKKPNTDKVLREIEKRVHDELNVTLNFKWIPENYIASRGAYESEMCKKLASNEEFDGFYVFEHKYIPEFDFAGFARKGYLKDISGMLQEYAPLLYNKYSKEQLEAASVDGKLYAVPSLYPKPRVVYAIVREDLMREYKISEIKTFDDYEKYLDRVSNDKAHPAMPGIIRGRETTMTIFSNAFGYGVIDEKEQLVYKKDDPEMEVLAWEKTPGFKKAVEYVSRWKKKGYVMWYNTISESSPESMESMVKYTKNGFLSGFIASTLSSYENLADELNSALMDSPSKGCGEFKAYRLYPDEKVRLLSPSDGCIVFKADSPNADRALMFLNWLQSSQENYDLMMYGREGADYTLEGQNYKLPDGYKTEYESPYLGWPSRDAFKNIRYERFPEGSQEGAREDYIDFISDNAEFSPFSGFYSDYSGIALDASARKGYLDSLIDTPLRDVSAGLDYEIIAVMEDATTIVLNTTRGQLNKWKDERKK